MTLSRQILISCRVSTTPHRSSKFIFPGWTTKVFECLTMDCKSGVSLSILVGFYKSRLFWKANFKGYNVVSLVILVKCLFTFIFYGESKTWVVHPGFNLGRD
jgi:hypothetical protein